MITLFTIMVGTLLDLLNLSLHSPRHRSIWISPTIKGGKLHLSKSKIEMVKISDSSFQFNISSKKVKSANYTIN